MYLLLMALSPFPGINDGIVIVVGGGTTIRLGYSNGASIITITLTYDT
jgi:hypothetical protein